MEAGRPAAGAPAFALLPLLLPGARAPVHPEAMPYLERHSDGRTSQPLLRGLPALTALPRSQDVPVEAQSVSAPQDLVQHRSRPTPARRACQPRPLLQPSIIRMGRLLPQGRSCGTQR